MVTGDCSCCFTGHRIIKKTSLPLIKQKIEIEVRKLIVQGVTHFIAGGALGFDTLAAQTVLELKKDYSQIKLILAIPCESQASKWNYKDKIIYEYIKNQADKVIYISKEYEKDCMLMRNKFMVDNSTFVIAMWDGRKYGGTFYTLKCAERLNKQIILVDYFQNSYTTKDIYEIERERK